MLFFLAHTIRCVYNAMLYFIYIYIDVFVTPYTDNLVWSRDFKTMCT